MKSYMQMLIPQLFTAGNLFCGFFALHYAFNNNYAAAAWLVFLGAVLDKMDGTIARLFGRDSLFGIQLDSIVDVCTFGFVPAVIVYHSYLNSGWGLVLAFCFLLCGAIRLARFNALSLDHEKDEHYYLGLPIPTAAICLTQFNVFEQKLLLWPTSYGTPIVVCLVLLLSFFMVSRLDYDSMPNFRSNTRIDRARQLFFIVSVGLIFHNSAFFFPVILIYIGSGPYRWGMGLLRNEIRQHA